jgi:hypothetical protein
MYGVICIGSTLVFYLNLLVKKSRTQVMLPKSSVVLFLYLACTYLLKRPFKRYTSMFHQHIFFLKFYFNDIYQVVHVWYVDPVRIRVRIDPPHPYACPSDETGKTEVPCRSRCDTIKIPPCSKALSAEHRPRFCSTSPEMVTYSYKWKILERDVKQ